MQWVRWKVELQRTMLDLYNNGKDCWLLLARRRTCFFVVKGDERSKKIRWDGFDLAQDSTPPHFCLRVLHVVAEAKPGPAVEWRPNLGQSRDHQPIITHKSGRAAR